MASLLEDLHLSKLDSFHRSRALGQITFDNSSSYFI